MDDRTPQSTDEPTAAGVSRRTMIGTAAAVGAAAWVAPSMLRLDRAAAAGSNGLELFSLNGDYVAAPGRFAFYERPIAAAAGSGSLLTKYVVVPDFDPDVSAFEGTAGGPGDTFPLVIKNNNAGVSTFQPAPSLVLQPGTTYGHPGPNSELVVRFDVPAGGAIAGSITYLVEPIHVGGGSDGVSFVLQLNGVVLASGTVAAGSSAGATIPADLSGTPSIELVLQPGGNYFADTTHLELDVTA